MGKCIELTGRNLSASDVCNIARGLCKVSVSTEAIERLVESRKLVFELSDKGVPIYGCNRGVGWNKDKKVTKEFVSQFNKNMLHSHSVGVGESASIEEARGAMVIRLNNLLVGCTGLSPEIVQLMAEMLNRSITPLFPKRGSVGEADIVNLSHLGLVLIGEGRFSIRALWFLRRKRLQRKVWNQSYCWKKTASPFSAQTHCLQQWPARPTMRPRY